MRHLLEYPQHLPPQRLQRLHSLDLKFEVEIIPGCSCSVEFGQLDHTGFHWSEVLLVPPRRLVRIGYNLPGSSGRNPVHIRVRFFPSLLRRSSPASLCRREHTHGPSSCAKTS